jgi:formylglycine-generating enzyme
MNWRCTLTAALVLVLTSLAHAQGESELVTNSVGMKFTQIPAGQFLMGRGQAYDEILRLTTISLGVDRAIKTEVPQHKVLISTFLMQVTEVTQQQWQDVMGTRPWDGKGSVTTGADYPATSISWEDAQKFCEQLSRREGTKYRLPTEAEWEYACRAGTSTIYSFGNEVSDMPDYGWITDNAHSKGEQFAHRVARQKPNGWGLYDMHGNVWEWCGDWFGEGYYGVSPEKDPSGPREGSARVVRGGSWRSSDTHARSTFRSGVPSSTTQDDLGFRVVLVAK